MSSSDPIPSPALARSRLASTIARRSDAEAVAHARQTLATANIAAAIRRNVEAAPPLTDAQRSTLAALLDGGAA